MGAILDAALEYAQAGFAVIPVTRVGKDPYNTGGSHNGSTDPEQIKEWWTLWPDANVAIVCGHLSGYLCAIDVDVKDGKHGDIELQKWEATHGDFPNTVIQRTGSGGWHYFFRYPDIANYLNTIDALPGIDIRGEYSYVVVTPSVYEDGRLYSWERDISLLDTDEIADANESVIEMLKLHPRNEKSSSKTSGKVNVADVKKGQRNDTLFRYAALQRGANVPEDIALESAYLLNESWSTPLQVSEVNKLVNSAYKSYTPNEATIYSLNPLQNEPEFDENGEYVRKMPAEMTMEYMLNPPPKKKPIIDSYLREGEAMLLSGNPKAGKSFLIVQLALAVATGKDWIGQPCHPKKVLYIDGELDPELTAERIKDLREKMGISYYPENLHVVNAMNQDDDSDELTLKDIADDIVYGSDKFDLVIIDPLYMFINSDENDNTEMGKELRSIRRIKRTGTAVIVVHHTTKGLQSGKLSIDRASGAGVLGRFFDSVLTLNLLNTEYDDPARPERVEGDFRSFRQPNPVNVWFDGFHTVDTRNDLSGRELNDPKKSANERKNANDTAKINHCYYWLKDNCLLREGNSFTLEDITMAYEKNYYKTLARTTMMDHLKKSGYIKISGTVEETVDGKTVRRKKNLYIPDGTVVDEAPDQEQ